jgi:hypothetical protein
MDPGWVADGVADENHGVISAVSPARFTIAESPEQRAKINVSNDNASTPALRIVRFLSEGGFKGRKKECEKERASSRAWRKRIGVQTRHGRKEKFLSAHEKPTPKIPVSDSC